MKVWLILIGLTLFSYFVLPNIITYLLLAATVYKILNDLHIIGESKFGLGSLKRNELYYLNLKGAYHEQEKTWMYVMNILKKFNLTEHYQVCSFGMYYDDPKKVKPEDCRSVLGICCTDYQSAELDSYLISEGFSKASMTQTSAIITRMSIIHPMFIGLAIKRYYKDLGRNLYDKEFLSKFRVSEVEKIPGIIEMFKKQTIDFYVPCGNFDKFDFYKADMVEKQRKNYE